MFSVIGQILFWGCAVTCGAVLLAGASHWVVRTRGEMRDAARARKAKA